VRSNEMLKILASLRREDIETRAFIE